ncbi:hypothetical protein [Nonomuraea sp. KM90]|uniref:hypothetical protein n=1 Tax=Nonomuraea sp. KM90 TaxID=3457428 RepID=UPI003FCD318A
MTIAHVSFGSSPSSASWRELENTSNSGSRMTAFQPFMASARQGSTLAFLRLMTGS